MFGRFIGIALLSLTLGSLTACSNHHRLGTGPADKPGPNDDGGGADFVTNGFDNPKHDPIQVGEAPDHTGCTYIDPEDDDEFGDWDCSTDEGGGAGTGEAGSGNAGDGAAGDGSAGSAGDNAGGAGGSAGSGEAGNDGSDGAAGSGGMAGTDGSAGTGEAGSGNAGDGAAGDGSAGSAGDNAGGTGGSAGEGEAGNDGSAGEGAAGSGDEDDADGGVPEDEEPVHVIICHYPPGYPENAQTIRVGEDAVQAHVDEHGDHEGPCESDEQPNQ